MKLANLARAAAAFALAWAAFAQMPGTRAHDGANAASAWPISRPRSHRPQPPARPPAVGPAIAPITPVATPIATPAAIPAAARR